ncbi:MAG: L-fucose:H+ symporter permease [Chitinophagaceae bacterium]|nr:MAG: L-fucose:H+ symporter permease [Chitinophagaceae bacterium]
MPILTTTATPDLNVTQSRKGKGFSLAFALVTSLFFLWGLAYGLLDVLNKHFQDALQIDKARSTLLQTAYFGAYFLIALPAGYFMEKFGYKRGIIFGLGLYATGAFLFYPSAEILSFPFFLLSMFVLASGLVFLETAANPYVTVLGAPASASFRINLAQSFNGVGTFIGPLIGGLFFFNEEATGATSLGAVKIVYIVIAIMVLLVAAVFWKTSLPEVRVTDGDAALEGKTMNILRHKPFTNSLVAQFFYIAAQVGIAALFINYCIENNAAITNTKASYLLSVSLLVFTLGRFTGTALMRRFAPRKLLQIFAFINIALCIITVLNYGWISIYSLIAIFFFESIMFPTIFALGLRGLGAQTKKGASLLIMTIVGGAIMPYFMGLVADHSSTAIAYLIPVFCFAVVAWYARKD